MAYNKSILCITTISGFRCMHASGVFIIHCVYSICRSCSRALFLTGSYTRANVRLRNCILFAVPFYTITANTSPRLHQITQPLRNVSTQAAAQINASAMRIGQARSSTRDKPSRVQCEILLPMRPQVGISIFSQKCMVTENNARARLILRTREDNRANLDWHTSKGVRAHHSELVRQAQYQADTAYKDYAKATVAYAKCQCLALAAEILDTLPGEIRDMIYAHYFNNEVEITADNKSQPWLRKCKTDADTQFTWENQYPLLLPSFVGTQVAQEACVAFYKLARYRRLPIEQLRCFLTVDHHILDIKPAHHLRRLEIDINVRKSPMLGDKRKKEVSNAGLIIIEQSFKKLEGIRVKKGFDLRVKFSYGCENRRLERILGALEPTYRALKEAGVNIVFRGCIHCKYEENLVDFYSLALEDWRNKWGLVEKGKDRSESDSSESSDLSSSSDEVSSSSEDSDDSAPMETSDQE
jgi:hypothetical protein